MSMSLLCRMQQDREHEPCSGTDDAAGADCSCWCHEIARGATVLRMWRAQFGPVQ